MPLREQSTKTRTRELYLFVGALRKSLFRIEHYFKCTTFKILKTTFKTFLGKVMWDDSMPTIHSPKQISHIKVTSQKPFNFNVYFS